MVFLFNFFFLVSYSLIRILVFWFGFGLDFGQNNRLGSELGKTWILSLSMSVVKYSSIRSNQSAIVISTWVTHYSLFIKKTLAQKIKKNGSLKITTLAAKSGSFENQFLISRSPLTVTKYPLFSKYPKSPLFRNSKYPLFSNAQFVEYPLWRIIRSEFRLPEISTDCEKTFLF